MLRLYNTLSRKKEDLPDQEKIRLFVCGPTVNDYAHIGHARTYLFFDLFAKYLRARGYDVEYLQNITDVDDKIIKRAAEERKKPEEVARFFTEAYLSDMRALGISSVSEYAPATKFISQIVAQVQRLIDKAYAYKIEGDGWYFDISKFPDYGKLSGRTAFQAEDSVSRIDESIGKKNKGDFCLWKFSKPGEPAWTAAIGNGRPGWHIEDTAISEFYFGPQYEIHGGGVDLKFPHHEAEIAQQESASGKKPFVRFWMHTGALLVDGKKMSKSLGNFITVRDFLKEHPEEVLRWIIFTHHYRSPIDYSDSLAQNAEATLETIRQFLGKLSFALKNKSRPYPATGSMDFPSYQDAVKEGLRDDINTPKAAAALFSLISVANKQDLFGFDEKTLNAIQEFVSVTLAAFGITLKTPKIPSDINALAEKREISRSNKQFKQADALRKEINGLGFDIEDTPKGPFLWPQIKNHN